MVGILLRRLIVVFLTLVAPMCFAENYLVAEAAYQMLRVDKSPEHNLRIVLPKYYDVYSLGYGYRTNSNWGAEVGYQRNKAHSKTSNLAVNQNLLFTNQPNAQTIALTAKITSWYLCAVGYHVLSTNSEFVGQFGLALSKISVQANNNLFNAAGQNSLDFKVAFGLQHKFGEFIAVRALIKYESTQRLKLAYRKAGVVDYFKPFDDTWGLSLGLLIKF